MIGESVAIYPLLVFHPLKAIIYLGIIFFGIAFMATAWQAFESQKNAVRFGGIALGLAVSIALQSWDWAMSF